MSSCLALNLNVPINDATSPKPLSIALIGPNEEGRRAVASALKNSPNADVFEFDSYPPERGYLRAIKENPFNVLILELDSDAKLSLELIEEACECPGLAVLAYSIRSDSKLTLKALQAGAMAYSISKDAGELRLQVDKLTADSSSAQEESTAASRSNSIDLGNAEECQHKDTVRLPSTLPEDFEGWDGHSSSGASIGNETQIKQAPSPVLVEPSENSPAIVSSLVHPKTREGEELRSVQGAPAQNDLSFWPKTLNDADETKPHDNSLKATERLLKISTSKLWSGILFSAERARKFDSAQLHDADREIEQMFRLSAEKSSTVKKLKRGGKIAVAVSLASALALAMGLLIYSHAAPLSTLGQMVLRGPVTAIMHTDGHR